MLSSVHLIEQQVSLPPCHDTPPPPPRRCTHLRSLVFEVDMESMPIDISRPKSVYYGAQYPGHLYRYRTVPYPARYADVLHAYAHSAGLENAPFKLQMHVVQRFKTFEYVMQNVEALGGTTSSDQQASVTRFSFQIGTPGFYILLSFSAGYESAWDIISNARSYGSDRTTSLFIIDQVSIVNLPGNSASHMLLEISVANTPKQGPAILRPDLLDHGTKSHSAYQDLCRGMQIIRQNEWQDRGDPEPLPHANPPPYREDMLGISTYQPHGSVQPGNQGQPPPPSGPVEPGAGATGQQNPSNPSQQQGAGSGQGQSLPAANQYGSAPPSQHPSYGSPPPPGAAGSEDPTSQWTSGKGKGPSRQQRREIEFIA